MKSDFSVLKRGKNTAGTDTENLSLEGILQYKEHEKFKALYVAKILWVLSPKPADYTVVEHKDEREVDLYM